MEKNKRNWGHLGLEYSSGDHIHYLLAPNDKSLLPPLRLRRRGRTLACLSRCKFYRHPAADDHKIEADVAVQHNVVALK